ncbi:unnamed protein product [Rotaria sp. Silwood2]|nr:unnamed protein product [Rotaria sp. Silwood2]CAF3060482.1 unnamed protein product [Rotaria sp. Silwood2]CAF4045013.1 unnamed protein product [Rotaria sp. Silwood2]CAF4079129.1 unnamed protein product [Rotaria sp. Silwood2]
MVSETKVTSDTNSHQHESTLSLLQLELSSSKNSDNLLKYRSENNMSSKKKIYNSLLQNSLESINNNYQRFSNNNLIHTHFPIANMSQDSTIITKTSSCQLPAVPKQAGTFIHRFVNKFFLMTNKNKNKKCPMKHIKRKHMNMKLNTRNLSDDSHTFLNIISKKRRQRRRGQQHSKITTNNNQHCTVCRKYRNNFSIVPMNKMQVSATDYPTESSQIVNTNATTNRKTRSILTSETLPTLSKIRFEKIRTLNESQCQTIVSAVGLIFDTLISNYQHFMTE